MEELFEELYKQIYVTFVYEERWRFFETVSSFV